MIMHQCLRSLPFLIVIVACGILTSHYWLIARAEPPLASEGESKETEADVKKTGLGLTVTPLPDWFKFESKDTVNGWINTDDIKAITTHAWGLWGALST